MKGAQKITLANGYCYLLDHYLVITDHSDPNEILRRKERNTIGAFLFVLGFFSIFTLTSATYFFLNQRQTDSYPLFVAGIFGLVIIIKWRHRSNVKVIQRSQIKNIQLKKVMFNPAFVILFKTPKGKFKERLLMMKPNDPQKIDEALRLLRNENLMSSQSINQQMVITIKDLKKNQSNQSTENYKTPPKTEAEKKPQTQYKRNADGYIKDY